MEPKTEINHYYMLRWYRPRTEDDDVLYAYNTSHSYQKRAWADTTKRSNAYHFDNRSDARKTVRSAAFDDLRKRGFFWEVIQVTETVVRTYTAEIITSDAPPLVVLARAAL